MRSHCLAFIALAFAAPAFAAGTIDGTWKTDLSTVQFTEKPDVFLLKDGVFTCSSCVPVFTVQADGAFHKLTGFPYFDEASVTVVDAGTVEEVDKLKGKVVGTSRSTLSADGKVLTTHWTDSSAPDGSTASGDSLQNRVAPAPVGAHAISGSWRTASVQNMSEAALTFTIGTAGGAFALKTPNGIHYEAKPGGPAVPIVGDNAGTTATVRKIAGGYEETDWRDGKAVAAYTMTLGADGRLKVVSENKLRGTATTFYMLRQ